jgi:hypothetical protein
VNRPPNGGEQVLAHVAGHCRSRNGQVTTDRIDCQRPLGGPPAVDGGLADAGTRSDALDSEVAVSDLVHDPALAQQFREEILRPRRSVVIDVLHHAVDRGELPANLDVELLMDIYVGAVFYRVVVSGEPVTDTLAEQLVGLILDGRQPVKPPRDEGPRVADDS